MQMYIHCTVPGVIACKFSEISELGFVTIGQRMLLYRYFFMRNLVDVNDVACIIRIKEAFLRRHSNANR